ncbi:MAG TPA: SLBB domain-containing protein [Elusimicrobiota bacterium]|nr:SLBB domain-containing protein [Elusimicrobiota bacterium]
MSDLLVKKIRQAGVVGAGGAGFPTYVKAESKAEVVVANGAECEPLLHKDKELLKRAAPAVVRGLEILMESTGATTGLIGIKSKNHDAVEAVRRALSSDRVKVHPLGDFYPAGDEYTLVYETTRRLIPPAGIPIEVGVVVNNVETLYNVSRAADGIPVTEKYVTVAGAVKNPSTFLVPLGCSFRQLIDAAGGVLVEDPVIVDGGPMMGKIVQSMDLPVTKTTGGLIVLSARHPLVWRKSQPVRVFRKIGKSGCDQCSYCTQLCPRYLLGYPIEPHKVMRSLGFTGSQKELWSRWALLCCECSLCSLYSCPEQLDPRNVCVTAKGDLRKNNILWKNSGMPAGPRKTHGMYPYRKTPIKLLMKRLGLHGYDKPAPLADSPLSTGRVTLSLSQHVGAPAIPVVKPGQKVQRGDVVAEPPEGKLGALLHSSLTGTVRQTDPAIVIES